MLADCYSDILNLNYIDKSKIIPINTLYSEKDNYFFNHLSYLVTSLAVG